MNRALPALALALLLVGCGGAATPQAGATASGEVLPGTISDSMLTTDQSQADAPLAPAAHSAASKDDGPAAAAASEPAPDASAAGESSPVAVERPSPKPTNSPKPTTP